MPTDPNLPPGWEVVNAPSSGAATGVPDGWEIIDHQATDSSTGWRNLGAGGLRLATGIAAGKGGIPGALIAGAGEAGAEMLEGSTFQPKNADPESALGKLQAYLAPGLDASEHPWKTAAKGFLSGAISPAARIATAATVGSVPVGKLMPAGPLLQRTGQAAIRSGALGTAGEAGREMASGEQLDPTRIGETGAISTVLGGLGGAVFGKKVPLTPAEEAKAATTQTLRDEAREARKAKAAMASPGGKAAQKAADAAESEWYDVKDAGEKWHSQQAVKAQAEAQKAAVAAAKKTEADIAQQRIDKAIAEGNLVPGKPNISEAATGQKSMRIPYVEPDEDAQAAAGLKQYLEKGFTPEQYADIKANAASEAPMAEVVTPETNPLRQRTGGGFNPDEWSAEESVPAPEYRPYAGERQLGPAPVQVGTDPKILLNTPVEKLTDSQLIEIKHLPPELGGTSERNTEAVQELMRRGSPEGAFSSSRTPEFHNLNTGEITTYDLDRGTRTSRTPPPATEVGPQPTVVNEARGEAASVGHPAEPITPEATAQGVAPLEGPTQPSSGKLAQLLGLDAQQLKLPLRSNVGAAGEDYAAAKLAEAAGGPSADEAYRKYVQERQALGQTTKPRTQRAAAGEKLPTTEVPSTGGGPEAPGVSESPTLSTAPDVPAGSTGPSGNWIEDQSALADAASKDPSLKARLLKLAQEEEGSLSLDPLSKFISPERARHILSISAGALIGAPVGKAISKDDDPYGALKGALVGAALGSSVANADPGRKLQEIINFRNASLLASPTVIGKKFLGDTMGIGWEGLKQALPGPNQDLNYAKDLFGATPIAQPKLWTQRVLEGLREDPNVTADLGTELRAAANSPLGIIGRPLSAAGYATKKALEDVGTPSDVIGRITGLGDPETKAGRWFWQGQKFAPVRILRPFARTGTHIAEGVRNIPNPLTMKAFGGPAEDAARRGAVGAIQMGVGAGSELYDESREGAGQPVSPSVKGLRMASMGLGGVVPYALGKAIMGVITKSTSADAAKDIINTIPGAHAVLPEQYPNETSNQYIARIGRNILESMSPSVLSPPSGNIR